MFTLLFLRRGMRDREPSASELTLAQEHMRDVSIKKADQVMWHEIAEVCKETIAAATQLMQQGDPTGQYIMAKYLRHGWGIEANVDEALKLYKKKAAKQGHAGAAYELSDMYMSGDDAMHINQDLDLADHYVAAGLTAAKLVSDKAYDTKDYTQAEYLEKLRSQPRLIEVYRRANVLGLTI